MSKIQKNFTTPEQSRRLLELGVPAISADFYYRSIYPVTVEAKPSPFFKPTFPCWSVGQLIWIYNKCVDFDLDDGAAIVIFTQEESPIVQMMEMFEDKVGIMDFSKLEE